MMAVNADALLGLLRHTFTTRDASADVLEDSAFVSDQQRLPYTDHRFIIGREVTRKESNRSDDCHHKKHTQTLQMRR